MFCIAPSKPDQAAWRYWTRNRYKANQQGIRLSNRTYSQIGAEPMPFKRTSQIKTHPRPMTEVEKTALIRLTGSAPLFDRLFIPVQRGRSRTQIGRKLKT